MRQTKERVEHYLRQWQHISARDFQDPDKFTRACTEAYGKANMRACLNLGISSTVTDSRGGQDVSLMKLGDGSEAWLTDGQSMGRHSFWEFDLTGFLRYRIPFQRIAFWVGAGIDSFFLHHRTGRVLETDVFMEDDLVSAMSQWLQRPRARLPRRFTILGSFREGFRLVSGRLKIFDPDQAQAALERMQDFKPVMAGR